MLQLQLSKNRKDSSIEYSSISGANSIYRSNPPADVCIERVIAGKNRDSTATANIPDFEIGIPALDTAGLGFLVEGDYNSIIIRKNCNRLSP